MTRLGGALQAFIGRPLHAHYPSYFPPEFRRQMVDLVRADGSPEDLAKAYDPTAYSIRAWIKAAAVPSGSSNS